MENPIRSACFVCSVKWHFTVQVRSLGFQEKNGGDLSHLSDLVKRKFSANSAVLCNALGRAGYVALRNTENSRKKLTQM